LNTLKESDLKRIRSSGNPTTIVPFLIVKNGVQAVTVYTNAFGAKELARYERPEGKLTSRMVIDDAEFCVGDEEPEFDHLSPDTIGGTAVRIVLTVPNPESVFSNAVEAGAIQICPVTTEEFWKIGKLKDPFGHIWEIGHPLNGAS